MRETGAAPERVPASLDRPAEQRDAPASGDPPDPAVAAAVRAHARLTEAEDLAARATQFREERTRAEQILARLSEQDHALKRAERDLRATAGSVYRTPDRAVEQWERLVLREGGNLERARERVVADPGILGPLRSEARPGLLGRLGVRTTGPAREAVPHLADRATAYTQAQRRVTDPVEWASPAGEVVRGREQVRRAAASVVGDRVIGITAVDRQLTEMGGVRGAEQSAQQALRSLSPDQTRIAHAQIARTHGQAAVRAATSLVSRGVQAARVARSLGEGPAGL